MNFWEQLVGSRSFRLGLKIGAGVLAVALLGVGAWLWQSRQESRGQLALAEAGQLVLQVETAQGSPEARDKAINALQGVIEQYPRLGLVPQAAYQLGNLRYAGGQYRAARGAYEVAIGKGATGSMRTLAALGIGYTWEAEKNYANAATAYESALKGLEPKSVLAEEGLLALARVQELGGKPAAALETYRRVLKDMPESSRGEELRIRIASLQSRAKQ